MQTRARLSSDDRAWRQNRLITTRAVPAPYLHRVSPQVSAYSPRLCRRPAGTLKARLGGLSRQGRPQDNPQVQLTRQQLRAALVAERLLTLTDDELDRAISFLPLPFRIRIATSAVRASSPTPISGSTTPKESA